MCYLDLSIVCGFGSPGIISRLNYFTVTVFAASSMNDANSRGCESITIWLDGIVMDLAFILSAVSCSRFGETIRSFPATTYQEGLDFHAAVTTLAPKAAAAGGPWVAVQTLSSAGDRSPA